MNLNLSHEDLANLASAERAGNIHTLNTTVVALDSIIDVLNSDYVEARPALRRGLHAAFGLITENLQSRADFLSERQEELSSGGAV